MVCDSCRAHSYGHRRATIAIYFTEIEVHCSLCTKSPKWLMLHRPIVYRIVTVPQVGVEPTRFYPHASETCLSASSNTAANIYPILSPTILSLMRCFASSLPPLFAGFSSSNSPELYQGNAPKVSLGAWDGTTAGSSKRSHS